MSSSSVMTPKKAEETYDKVARNYHITYGAYRPEIEQVVEAANLSDSDTVLDLGTGTGWVASAAGKKCALAVGIDISPNMIDQARKNHEEEAKENNSRSLVRFETANMRDLKSIQSATKRVIKEEPDLINHFLKAGGLLLPDEPPRFTVIVMNMAFSHVPDNAKSHFLQILKQYLLVKGGRIVIAHESLQQEVDCIQLQWCFMDFNLIMKEEDPWVFGYWGKSRVAGEASEDACRAEIDAIARSVGLTIVSSVVKNKDPKYGFKDSSQTAQRLAEQMSGTKSPKPEDHNRARYRLAEDLLTKFRAPEEKSGESHEEKPEEGRLFHGRPVMQLTVASRFGTLTVIVVLKEI